MIKKSKRGTKQRLAYKPKSKKAATSAKKKDRRAEPEVTQIAAIIAVR